MDVRLENLKLQVDPEALALWNRLADGDGSALNALTEILQEDFPTFCGLLLKVRPKGGGWTTPFVFNQVQRRMWREICDRLAAGREPWFVVLKFRQAGMSTFWCAWLFWQMWRQKDVQTMVVAHQLQTAETMIETQRVFYDELPEVFRPDLREGNHGATIPRGEIYFADRRCWQLIHLSKNVDPRGQQVTFVLETEHAMYGHPGELNGALLPQLPPFGSEARLRSSVIIESTPKGQNDFFDLYEKAKKGKIQSFKSVFFPWFLFDEQYSATAPDDFLLTAEEKHEQQRLSAFRMNDYDERDGGGKPVTRDQMYWRRETIAAQYDENVDQFDQEYPSDDHTCFLLASRSVFRPYMRELDAMTAEARERASEAWGRLNVTTDKPMRVMLKPKQDDRGTWRPIRSVDFECNAHGQWLVWEPPVQGHKYCLGGDPAMGLEGGDASVVCVIDVTTARQVAEYAGNTGPEKYALEMCAAGFWYHTGLLIPEINSVGFTVLNEILGKITYPNVFKWPKWDEVNRYTHKRGWETNNRTKQLMVSSMIHYVEEGLISIASRELLSEMSLFEQKAEEDYWHFQAQKGHHDDRVMAFGLAIMGIMQTPILSAELQKVGSRIPTARELHLATTMADLPPTPLPKQLEAFIKVDKSIPWNPISEGFLV